jgi:PIN domain nuclease of toxin-antitoxin system
LLLDTQVALWRLTGSPRPSQSSRELMAGSPCVESVASAWEVDLKHRLGKSPIALRRFRDEMRSAGATIPSITDEHVLTVVKTRPTHRDPFDRLVLSVADVENLVLFPAHAALIALSGSANPAFPRGAPDPHRWPKLRMGNVSSQPE